MHLGLEHFVIPAAIIEDDFDIDKRTISSSSFTALAFGGYTDEVVNAFQHNKQKYRKLIVIQVL